MMQDLGSIPKMILSCHCTEQVKYQELSHLILPMQNKQLLKS